MSKKELIKKIIGPVGIENSWAVGAEGLEKLTICEESIIEL